jgi:anti-anti-sigma factor
MSDLWMHAVTQVGETCTVALAGELDVSGKAALAELLIAAVRSPGTTAVVVNLGRVDFIDSSAISALLSSLDAAEALGRRFTVVQLRPHVRRVLDISGLLPLLSGEDTSPTDHLAG